MATATTPTSTIAPIKLLYGWYVLLCVMGIVYVIQPMWLICACPLGTKKHAIALLIETCILGRALFGIARKQKGSVWIFYVIIVIAIPFVIPAVMKYHGGH